MSLSDDLNDYPGVEEEQYTPRTEFDGTTGFIQTASFPVSEAPDFTAILEQFGYDPTKVRIVGSPRVSRWQQRSRIRGTSDYEETWLCAYRFHIAPSTDSKDTNDLEALVKASKRTHSKTESKNGFWFVFQAGDLQLGKRSRDGSTEQIIDRYVQSVEAAKRELKTCKRLGIGGVQISMPGDCIEGVVSQKGQNVWLTQETITEQTRILRRLMLYTIDELSTAPSVFLDVVNGNHDQAQRQQNTYPGDGWATEAAVAVSDALQLNPGAYGHVSVRVPEKWSGMMTVPVGDTVVTVVHGHQWSRAIGPMKWWADQAVNHQPAGASQILQFGHWHEYQTRSNAHRIAIGAPTLDCGSDWYREKTGATSKRGALMYLLRAGDVSRLTLI